MNDYRKSLFYIHLSVLLFGFSALFARWVNQPSFVITFGRVFFSSIFLFFIIKIKRQNFRLLNKKDYFLIVFAGVFLAIHWYCFIQSIQLSTVAIGTITFATFPVFVSFLEPFIFREKIKVRIVICSILMLAGIFIISSVDSLESGQRTSGVIVGLVSSLTFAVLSLLNRYFSAKYRPEIIVFYEQASAAIVLAPLMFLFKPAVVLADLVLLAIFGIVFTAIAHGLFVRGLRNIKASAAGIISGLEAVYSIFLAALLLGEFPHVNEIVGGLIVLSLAGYITLSARPAGPARKY